MTEGETRRAVGDMVYLVSCAVNDEKPESDKTAGMDLSLICAAAQRHQLTSAVGMALEAAGIRDSRIAQETAKAQRKNALLDADRAALIERLESAGIWYMPLKGAVMQALYPRYGMRQMADNDILIDAARAQDVKGIMEELGFTTERVGRGVHDVYHKPPVSNFEIHNALFSPVQEKELHAYYRDVKSRLVKDPDNRFGWHFTPEDFYLYLLAHARKHFAGGGTGLRTFLDIYVYLKKNGASLNMAYIETEAEKLALSDFERRSRSLATHLFGQQALTPEDQEMLAYVIQSGTYGTTSHRVNNQVAKLGGGVQGKIRFFLRRAFPPMETIKIWYPLIYKHRFLLPLLPLVRLGKALTVSRRKVVSELRALLRKPTQTDPILFSDGNSHRDA